MKELNVLGIWIIIYITVFTYDCLSGSGYRPNRPERPTQGPSDPWSLILSGSKIPWPLDLSGPNMTIPEVPAQSPLTCEFGRLLDQQGSCRSLYMRNQATDCPEGFTCQTAYGLCCAGKPYVRTWCDIYISKLYIT